ncbi:MAG: GtrA family protein [Microcystis aeruginosa K13-05]|jgi:putative flippase GtrA|uniref:GtrA family protein n=1 Tax=unclassified Microcystis TaxID=2643300 RepID=UPI0022C429D1|nr:MULTISPECIES: GtrA family protein [unclassified Microcystis]MCZ8047578.1 GtrA family protein [Microcystis sp. LE19-41.2A]MCZ8291170.1 GtrA family protein [Microcystis sp. LE19-59.1C]NCR81955.1 GtrA family protein [Microcystis aeruginosa K13-10]NCR86614.1 GtrA family protein [Microcystis aeruginosa K13-05]
MQRSKTLFKSGFLKFLLVGLFCTLQNVFWLYLLTTILKFHYLVSTIILMITVNSLGFYLNKRYTFKTYKTRTIKSVFKELIKYHTVMLSSSLIVLGLMYVFVDIFRIWYIMSNLVISIGMSVYNFLIHKRWTFK